MCLSRVNPKSLLSCPVGIVEALLPPAGVYHARMHPRSITLLPRGNSKGKQQQSVRGTAGWPAGTRAQAARPLAAPGAGHDGGGTVAPLGESEARPVGATPSGKGAGQV